MIILDTLYGESLIFQDVLRTYGEDVVLPIHYFLSNEIFTLELMRSMSETALSALNAVRDLWRGSPANGSTTQDALTSEGRGRYAIHFINEEGYGFLGQFLMTPSDQVAWVQTEGGSLVGARMVKYGAPVVLAYMAIRHPSIINSLLGRAAEKLGLPVALVQVLGWTFVLFPILLILRFMIAPLVWVMSGVVAALKWGDKALGRRAEQQP